MDSAKVRANTRRFMVLISFSWGWYGVPLMGITTSLTRAEEKSSLVEKKYLTDPLYFVFV